MLAASFTINLTVNMEVQFMINVIFLICLAAGTTLLGRSGVICSNAGRGGIRDNEHTVRNMGGAWGGSIPPPPRHLPIREYNGGAIFYQWQHLILKLPADAYDN